MGPPFDALEMNAPDRAVLRLTQFSHGGGCGCKIAPAVLQELIAKTVPGIVPKELLVGIETADDAAVYRINETQAIVATTDFFMPIVDDPFDFGAIAATNALSDVYAMGASPLFALALVGMPVDRLPVETIRRVLEGGEAICAKAGIPVAGGHTTQAAQAGSKRTGSADGGSVSLDDAHYATMLASTTQLNTPGIALGRICSVHALTDVTGFGLLGHLLEMCRGSQAGARIEFGQLPLHPGVLELAHKGVASGASNRNWASYGQDVKLADRLDGAARALLTDPQTSGGLLAACAPDAVDEVLGVFRNEGFERATAIGRIVPGIPQVTVV